jgi:hypothetical protein
LAFTFKIHQAAVRLLLPTALPYNRGAVIASRFFVLQELFTARLALHWELSNAAR